MHSFIKRTAQLFCFSRRQLRGLRILATLLWMSVLLRVWVYYHPAREHKSEAALAAWQQERSGAPSSDGHSTAQWVADTSVRGTTSEWGLMSASFKDSTETESQPKTELQEEVTDWRAMQKQKRTEAKIKKQVEINSADTTQLMALRGIGRTLARRVVSYRNLLGGYSSTEQLKEVYGLRAGLVDTLSAQLTVDTLAVRQMELPGTAYRDLLRHPYLEKEDVDNIMAFLEINGGMTAVEELLDNKVLSRETYRRIRPYLKPAAGTNDRVRQRK